MLTVPSVNPNAFTCHNAFLPCSLVIDKNPRGSRHVPGISKGRIRSRDRDVTTTEAATTELSWEADAFSVTALLPEPCFKPALTRRPSWWLNDRLELLLAFGNTVRLVQVILFPSGTSMTNLVEIYHNHLVCDVSRRITRCDLPLEFTADYSEQDQRMSFRLRLRVKDLAWILEEEPPLFLRANVMRYRAVGGEEVTFWQPPGPAGFVDGRSLGFWWKGKPEVLVEEFGWSAWHWGRNTARIVLSNLSNEDIDTDVSTRWRGMDTCRSRVQVPASGSLQTSCVFYLDPMEILKGEWSLEAGSAVLVFPVGWKRGFPGRFRCGESLGKADAGRDDSPFLRRVSSILERLPSLERNASNILKTSSGAEIDLGREGAVSELAGLISRIFEDRDERLAAATLLVNDPAVFVSSSFLERFHAPEAILAAGGGMCRASSVLTAAIISALPGERPACLVHVGSPRAGSGLPSHYFAGAKRDGSVIPLDGELGRFFLNRNGALASLEELTASPGLAEESGYGLSGWFKGDAASSLSLRSGPLAW